MYENDLGGKRMPPAKLSIYADDPDVKKVPLAKLIMYAEEDAIRKHTNHDLDHKHEAEDIIEVLANLQPKD